MLPRTLYCFDLNTASATHHTALATTHSGRTPHGSGKHTSLAAHHTALADKLPWPLTTQLWQPHGFGRAYHTVLAADTKRSLPRTPHSFGCTGWWLRTRRGGRHNPRLWQLGWAAVLAWQGLSRWSRSLWDCDQWAHTCRQTHWLGWLRYHRVRAGGVLLRCGCRRLHTSESVPDGDSRALRLCLLARCSHTQRMRLPNAAPHRACASLLQPRTVHMPPCCSHALRLRLSTAAQGRRRGGHVGGGRL